MLTLSHAEPAADSSNSTTYNFEAELQADDGGLLDWFGSAVSLSGNRVVIGAPGDDDNSFNAGAAYVFEFDGTDWLQTFKLKVTSVENTLDDQLGYAVSLDGDRVMLGAWNDGANGASSGSVYVFEFNGTSWLQTSKITASDADQWHEFGAAISLEADRVVIGAPFHSGAGTAAGAAYVFEYDGLAWIEKQKLIALKTMAYDHFGQAVRLKGNRVLIGAPRKDNTSGNDDVGSAFVFDFDGIDWNHSASLIPADDSPDGLFGTAVDFEGDVVVVGAYRDDNNQTGLASGSAYIFEHDGNVWSQVLELTAANSRAGDFFGASVKLLNNRLLIGAPRDDVNDFEINEDQGAAYLFEYIGTEWHETARIAAANSDQGDYFGFASDMQGDLILLGDGRTINDPNTRSAYVFRNKDLTDLIFANGFD